MKPMKKGKWVSHDFTPDQLKARAIWERQRAKRTRIMDALVSPCGYPNRATAHKKLDKVMDSIDAGECRARELFPEVDESFTIASMDVEF